MLCIVRQNNIVLSVVRLSIIILSAECHNTVCHCVGILIMSVNRQNVIMLTVVRQNDITLTAIS